jgi:beta-glucosidase
VKELKGFRRVSLAAGARTTVTFEVAPDDLAFYDIDMTYRVEPGEFRLMVGTSSRDEDLQSVTLTVR